MGDPSPMALLRRAALMYDADETLRAAARDCARGVAPPAAMPSRTTTTSAPASRRFAQPSNSPAEDGWNRRCLARSALKRSRARTTRRSGATVRVVVAHDPSVFDRAVDAGVHVFLAGHLHGGQCVLATRRNLLYPGAFFAR